MGIENLDAAKSHEADTAKKTEEEIEGDFADNKAEAHSVDENPEDHCGDETLDPWADKTQTDWPNDDSVVTPVEVPKEES